MNKILDLFKRGLFFFLLSTHIGLCAENLTTTVQADSAVYDGNRIILSGNVDVNHESYQIKAKSAILVRDEKKQTRFEFPWVELMDEVHAHFMARYFVECEKVNFDYVTRHLVFTSEKRVFFHEDKRKIYAEMADVEYTEQNGKFALHKIILLGNVEMHLVSSGEEEKKEQYALADRVEYYPEKELILLRANPDKRVLFFDKIHEVTISSQNVKAQKKAGKEIVEGMGDVRFVFKEEELEKLKQRFAF